MRRSFFIGGLACTALIGLGMFSTAAVLAQGVNVGPNNESPPENPTVDANGVDIASGTPTYEKVELSIGGNGIGALPLIRYYSGTRFRTNFDNNSDTNTAWLEPSKTHITFGNSSEGFVNFQPKTPTGSMGASIGYSKKDGTFVSFTHPHFSSSSGGSSQTIKLADYIEYPNDVRWTIHYLDRHYPLGAFNVPISRVQSVTSNTGYQLKFYYSSDTDPTEDSATQTAWKKAVKVVAINNAYEYCDPTANSCALTMTWPEVQYSDGAPDYSVIVTDPAGGQTYYRMSGLRIKEPGSAVDNRVYTMQSLPGPCPPSECYNAIRVVSANINGKITNYTHVFDEATSRWIVTSTGPSSETNTYYLSASALDTSNYPQPPNTPYIIGSVRQHVDSLNKIHLYEYQAGFFGYPSGNLTKATLPEGNIFELTRDNDGNVTETRVKAKVGSGLADIVSSQTIGPFAQPLTKTDAKGNVTTFTYNAVHGGVLTETGAAVNGVAPVKRYAYAQRYAWIKNSSGAYVQAAQPVWVKTEERTCRTSATSGNACAAGAGDEIVTIYDYGPDSGPNNLQVRGMVVTADGVSLRTCYNYDIRGNQISQTSARAGLSSCS